MKILISADWHFHSFKAHSYVTPEGENSRLFQLCEAWNEMLGLALKLECQTILVAGDMFQIRGSIKPSVYNTVFALVDSAKTFGIDVVIIPGNHDMEDFKGGPTAVEVFDTLHHVSVFSSPGILDLDGLKVAGVPYQNSSAAWEDLAKKLTKSAPDVWLCHQGIDDFKPSAGIPDTSLTVERIQAVIGYEVPAFFGHYHKLGSLKNIIQCGAPVQHNWGDVGQDRGVWFWDSKDEKAAFHALTSHPKFVKIDDSTSGADVKKNDFVKIVSSDPAAAAKLAKSVKKRVGDVVVEIKKEYVSTHRKSVKVDTVGNMLAEFITLDPELKEFKEDMLTSYREVCCD